MKSVADTYCWNSHRKLLPPAQTHIPALPTFGIQTRNSAGISLLPHIHPDCMEIVFLSKGFQCFEVDGQMFNLSGNDIFVTYPDEPHSSGSYPESINEYIWFQLNLRTDLPFLGMDETHASDLRKALLTLPRVFKGSSQLYANLEECFFNMASDDMLRRSIGLHSFICSLYRMLYQARNLELIQADEIENAVIYIHEHIFEPILLEDVAASCSLSLSRFKTGFKEKIGITPRTFINYLKIEQSKILLKNHSVTETAHTMGFDTPNYFATVFRRFTGQTPSQFISGQ